MDLKKAVFNAIKLELMDYFMTLEFDGVIKKGDMTCKDFDYLANRILEAVDNTEITEAELQHEAEMLTTYADI